MYFCHYFTLSNGSNWEVIVNTNIWGHFLSKFGNLTPQGDPNFDYMGQITKITPEMD
jgi:hypothetical protein